MKTGLILEGGAMRGMFTCGALDVMMEHGLRFDGAAGISAGAVFGCNIKSRQAGRALRYNLKYIGDPRYCSLRSLLKTGDLYGADFCYRELPETLDPFDRETFRTDPMAFYVGATDIDTGRIVYHLCADGGKEDMRWLRASASMPFVSRPVEIGGRRYLDGGIAEAVPLSVMEREGYDRCVLILTRPRGYRKEKSRPLPHFLPTVRRYPALGKAMAARSEMYNAQMDWIDRAEKEGRILTVRPPRPLGIRRTEKRKEELERVYRIGRETMEQAIAGTEDFLRRMEGGR
ncbi:MAG: patatin family protein [Bacteroidales bacterium]|nr:patatin family protein [Bacteroidales bacterium]